MASNYIKSIPVAVDLIPKTGQELNTYLIAVITEAQTLIDTLVSPPKDPWNLHFTRSNQFAEVEVSSRNHHIGEGTEYWFARRSVHQVGGEDPEVDAKETIEWDDFKNLLFHYHSENEREYGPSVSRVDVLDIEWDVSGLTVPGWEVVRVGGYAIHHHLPWPFNSRVFPILLVLVSAIDTKEFMVISLPIKIPLETKGRNTETKEVVLVIGPKATVGQYVAVERVTYRESRTKDEKPAVTWSMATASDASGNIPMALQRRVIGTSIFKDVEAFLDYAMKKKAAQTSL